MDLWEKKCEIKIQSQKIKKKIIPVHVDAGVQRMLHNSTFPGTRKMKESEFSLALIFD